MKKFVLIAAITLVSAAAQAGAPRSLTLAANETPAATQPAAAQPVAAQPSKTVEPLKTAEPAKSVEPAKAAEAPAGVPCATDVKSTDVKTTDAPKFVERPSAVDTLTPADQPKLDAKPVATQKASKPKQRRGWNEARIIGELHRHGIYW